MTDARLGTTLRGRYRLDSILGEGGMGAVYVATDLQLDRRVAVKMLHAHLTSRADLVARFIREAKSVGRVGHPNIVQISDAYPVVPVDAGPTFVPEVDGGDVFLVMEHLVGTTLGGLIEKEGHVEARRLVRIISQLLAALGAAHRAGIVHRDIKPENVFLTTFSDVQDVVKVLDFGIAKLKSEGPAEKLTQTGAFLGTPAYMSPEQVRGEPADQRADLYAVGACMYHALSGKLPFDGTSVATVLVAVLQEPPRSLTSFGTNVPPTLVPIVERALSKDKTARYQTADEMSEALARWSASVAPSTTGPQPSQKLAQQDRTAAFLGVPPALSTNARPSTNPSVQGGRATWSQGQAPPAPQAPWAALPPTMQSPPHVPQGPFGQAPIQPAAPHVQTYAPQPPRALPYPQPRPRSNPWLWLLAIPIILFAGCFATCVGISLMGSDNDNRDPPASSASP